MRQRSVYKVFSTLPGPLCHHHNLQCIPAHRFQFKPFCPVLKRSFIKWVLLCLTNFMRQTSICTKITSFLSSTKPSLFLKFETFIANCTLSGTSFIFFTYPAKHQNPWGVHIPSRPGGTSQPIPAFTHFSFYLKPSYSYLLFCIMCYIYFLWMICTEVFYFPLHYPQSKCVVISTE